MGLSEVLTVEREDWQVVRVRQLCACDRPHADRCSVRMQGETVYCDCPCHTDGEAWDEEGEE